MQSIVRLVRAVAVSMLVAATGNCLAEEITPVASADEATRWACWYSPSDETIRCLLAAASVSAGPERVAAADRAGSTRLPEIVRTIWGHPERLADRDISIPMWTTPTEMAFADQLAKSVMCGAQKSCTVNFDPNLDGRAALRVAMRMAEVPEEEIVAAVGAQGFVAVMAQSAAEEQPTRSSRRRRAAS